jgi:hypothetical protein
MVYLILHGCHNPITLIVCLVGREIWIVRMRRANQTMKMYITANIEIITKSVRYLR